MLPILFLSLREGLEAALIISIVLGTLTRINRNDLKKQVWSGVIAALTFSAIVAVILRLLGATLEGKAEEIFEGFAMLLAAGVLTWVIFWMRRQTVSLKQELEADVRHAATQTGGGAMFWLAFLAVGREGLELALFLFVASVDANAVSVLVGAFIGLTASVVVGWLLNTSTRQLNLKQFFQVTNVLLVLFAAGLVAYGVHEFNEAGWIPAVIEHVWDINHILSDSSTVGGLLKALFGYNGNPSLTEVIAYIGYFVALALGMRTYAPDRKPVTV
ncbi:MAG: FTR1 family protein [Anaerolineaceae bacterium]|nr:FTR1 family protein [Anaerolineaceae bacterium]